MRLLQHLAGAIGLAALLLSGCATEAPISRPASSSAPSTSTPRPRASGSAPSASSGTAKSASSAVPLSNPDEKDYAPRPDEVPANVASIPDAVPQNEERSLLGNPSSYEVYGKRYEILSDVRGFRERGYASWYGKKFHGKRTSSGAAYDMYSMTGAHKTLPIPCYVRVTNVANGKSVIVKINDRGPFHDGRIVDLSYAAATRLEMLGHGSVLVELEAIVPGETPAPVAVASADADNKTVIPADKAPLQTEKPPVIVPQPPPPPVGRPRYLQAGVFGDAMNAAAFREKLSASGIKPLLMKSESRNNRWVYRVLIGPFEESKTLDAERARLGADATPTIPVVD